MPSNNKEILSLLEYIQIDAFNVTCHFKCLNSDKRVVSSVAFEPYDGKIEFTWKELLLHPIASYNRYYHTPITIYAADVHETIVLKAFQKVAQHFH